MLSKLSSRLSRGFSGKVSLSVANAPAQQVFQPVPFKKEDPADVLASVPDVNYYVFPEATPYPFREVPMHEPVVTPLLQSTPQSIRGEFEFSKLENGLRVASIDKQGLTAEISLVVNAGPRFECVDELGVSDFVKQVAFTSTAHLSHLRTVKTIEALGATASCSVSREHIIYHIECLREYMPIAVTLLTGNILFPRLLEWEVNLARTKFEKDRESFKPDKDAMLDDLVHATAYHNNSLGRRLTASDSNNFTPEAIRSFMLKNFSMENSMCSAVNVSHKELTLWLSRAFADYTPIPHSARPIARPQYTGGYLVQEASETYGNLYVAAAFEMGGWNSADVVAGTVLQTLLGGGGSYSTGGPGKGMHSRLYLQVLNSKYFVDHCQAFSSIHSDSGLFGINISGQGKDAAKLIGCLIEQLGKFDSFTKEEIKRAKNLLKGNLFSANDNAKAVCEDAAKQILMGGRYLSPIDFVAQIDAVSEADIISLAKKLLNTPITLVLYGDTAQAPHLTQVQKLLDAAKKGWKI